MCGVFSEQNVFPNQINCCDFQCFLFGILQKTKLTEIFGLIKYEVIKTHLYMNPNLT